MNFKQLSEMSDEERSYWLWVNKWTPVESAEGRVRKEGEEDTSLRYRCYQKALYDEINKAFGPRAKEGVSMDAQWWKPQTAGASVARGCHLCGEKTVKRVTVEKLRHKKVEGVKRWVWEQTITKTFKCGTTASQSDDAEGATRVKVGPRCIDISEIAGPPEEDKKLEETS